MPRGPDLTANRPVLFKKDRRKFSNLRFNGEIFRHLCYDEKNTFKEPSMDERYTPILSDEERAALRA